MRGRGYRTGAGNSSLSGEIYHARTSLAWAAERRREACLLRGLVHHAVWAQNKLWQKRHARRADDDEQAKQRFSCISNQEARICVAQRLQRVQSVHRGGASGAARPEATPACSRSKLTHQPITARTAANAKVTPAPQATSSTTVRAADAAVRGACGCSTSRPATDESARYLRKPCLAAHAHRWAEELPQRWFAVCAHSTNRSGLRSRNED